MCRPCSQLDLRSFFFASALTTLVFQGCGPETASSPSPANSYKAMTEGPIYQRMTHIDNLIRQFASTDEGDPVQARLALKNSTDAVIATAKSVLSSESVDEFDRNRAAKSLFEAYTKLVGFDISKYPEFLTTCEELIQRYPKTDLATQAAFLRVNVIGTVRADLLPANDDLKDPGKRLVRMIEAAGVLAEQEPPHPNTPVILFNLARQLEQEANFSESAKFYRILAEKFPDQEKRRFAPGHFRRVSLVGQPATGINGKDFDGNELSSDQLKGKVVLVDFWASWCPPCLAELDGMKKLHEELGPKGFEILGMNTDDDFNAALKIIKDRRLSWPEISTRAAMEETLNPEDSLEFQLGIEFLPTKLILDREGVVVWTGSQFDLARPVIENLIAKAPAAPAASPATGTEAQNSAPADPSPVKDSEPAADSNPAPN